MCEEHERLKQVVEDLHSSEDILLGKLRKLEEERAQLEEQGEALKREITYLAMRNGKLKAQTEREAGEGAQAAVVIDVIEYWAARTGHEKAKVSAAGKRAEYVRKALKLGHTPEELKEAIDGAALYPYTHPDSNLPGKRSKTPGTLYDDIPTIFRDEVQIARMRKLAQRRTVLPAAATAPDPLEPTPGLKAPIDRVLVALYEQGWECPEPDVWITSCPVCLNLDKLVVRRHEDGMVALECLRGCELWRLLKALGLEASDLWHGARSDGEPARPEHLKAWAEVLTAELAKYR